MAYKEESLKLSEHWPSRRNKSQGKAAGTALFRQDRPSSVWDPALNLLCFAFMTHWFTEATVWPLLTWPWEAPNGSATNIPGMWSHVWGEKYRERGSWRLVFSHCAQKFYATEGISCSFYVFVFLMRFIENISTFCQKEGFWGVFLFKPVFWVSVNYYYFFLKTYFKARLVINWGFSAQNSCKAFCIQIRF